MHRSASVAALVLVLLATGCTTTPGVRPLPTSTATGAAESTCAVRPAAGPTTSATDVLPSPFSTVPGQLLGHGLLVDARVAAQDGFDRIVFEFESAVPAHLIRYADLPVTDDGAGEVVPLDGDAALLITFNDASGYRNFGDTVPAYPVASRLSPELLHVKELVNIGDFENQLTWAAGVQDTGGCTVSVLDRRLIVDVDHD